RGRVHRLRGDDPELARRQLPRVRSRVDAADHLAGAGEPESLRVDRGDVVAREVVGPHFDIVEPREVGREERADGAAADDADPHAYVASRPRTSAYTAVCNGASTPCSRALR